MRAAPGRGEKSGKVLKKYPSAYSNVSDTPAEGKEPSPPVSGPICHDKIQYDEMKLPSSMLIFRDQTSQSQHQCLIAWILSTFYGDCIWRARRYLSIPTPRADSQKRNISLLCAFACEHSQEGTKPKVQHHIQAYRYISKLLCMKIPHKNDRKAELHLKYWWDMPVTWCLRELWLLMRYRLH